MKMTAAKEPNNHTYIKFIAYLQIIGIILVVLGHSFHEYPDSNHGVDLLIYRMMFSFRMPLFMFVSGYLMVYTTLIRNNFNNIPKANKFITSKIKRLLLPFITLTLVTFIPRCLMSAYADDPLDISLQSLMLTLTEPKHLVIPYYWFLQASFIMLTTTYVIMSLCRQIKLPEWIMFSILGIAFLILSLTYYNLPSFFSINQAARIGIFFVLGMIYGRYSSSIDKLIPWTSIIFLITAAIIWAILFFITENTLWITACSLFGILMMISLAKILEYRKFTFLDHLTGANYMIFLLSWFFNVAFQQILSHIITLPWWVYTILSLTAGIYIPWLSYHFLKKRNNNATARVISFLLGQKFRKER